MAVERNQKVREPKAAGSLETYHPAPVPQPQPGLLGMGWEQGLSGPPGSVSATEPRRPGQDEGNCQPQGLSSGTYQSAGLSKQHEAWSGKTQGCLG